MCNNGILQKSHERVSVPAEVVLQESELAVAGRKGVGPNARPSAAFRRGFVLRGCRGFLISARRDTLSRPGLLRAYAPGATPSTRLKWRVKWD